ncbi:hypothetical protein DFR70_12186 [Nocardia tenerifensis]|uniref:Uncharacterized protein n=2 Tax=Nocardia tenerifensis TaxID=228006 RepID=A0A318JQE9_9NOCA|nr:hypothetical protein DFR70_12186 [Nocardia tenerifensis]
MQPVIDSAERLTRRGEWFVSAQCVRVESPSLEKLRGQWLEFGIPATQVARVLDFQRRWGGLVLPPSVDYEGGPKMLWGDMLAEESKRVGWFEAGIQRVSMAYDFLIGPAGEFGIDTGRWVPLHASIEGWIESVALAHHASTWAQQLSTIRGDAIDDLPPRDFEPVPEVRGLADMWWRGPDSLIAIHTGEAVGFDQPRLRVARVYGGLRGGSQ